MVIAPQETAPFSSGRTRVFFADACCGRVGRGSASPSAESQGSSPDGAGECLKNSVIALHYTRMCTWSLQYGSGTLLNIFHSQHFFLHVKPGLQRGQLSCLLFLVHGPHEKHEKHQVTRQFSPVKRFVTPQWCVSKWIPENITISPVLRFVRCLHFETNPDFWQRCGLPGPVGTSQSRLHGFSGHPLGPTSPGRDCWEPPVCKGKRAKA